MGNTNELSKWIIYMYTFPNGKKYIGKTSKTLKERQGVGFCNYDKNTILGKAIDKYKIENIKQDILFESEMTDEYSSRLEMICIALFKTNCLRYANPSYGYNMTDGGEGRVGVPGMSGTANPNCGKTGVLSVRSIGCYCVEDNKYFESLNLAAQYYKTSTSHLSKCCKNPFLIISATYKISLSVSGRASGPIKRTICSSFCSFFSNSNASRRIFHHLGSNLSHHSFTSSAYSE